MYGSIDTEECRADWRSRAGCPIDRLGNGRDSSPPATNALASSTKRAANMLLHSRRAIFMRQPHTKTAHISFIGSMARKKTPDVSFCLPLKVHAQPERAAFMPVHVVEAYRLPVAEPPPLRLRKTPEVGMPLCGTLRPRDKEVPERHIRDIGGVASLPLEQLDGARARVDIQNKINEIIQDWEAKHGRATPNGHVHGRELHSLMPQLKIHDSVTGVRYLRDRAKQQSIGVKIPDRIKPLFAA